MVELEKVQMTDEELKEKKLQLEHAKISRDESDLMVLEMEETLDVKLATRLLEDDMVKLKEDIDEKVIYDSFGKKIDATEADLDRMTITLDKFKRQLELDIPGRKLRLSINQLRDAKERIDAPEKQIKKLEREIREKAYEMVARPANNPMVD